MRKTRPYESCPKIWGNTPSNTNRMTLLPRLLACSFDTHTYQKITNGRPRPQPVPPPARSEHRSCPRAESDGFTALRRLEQHVRSADPERRMVPRAAAGIRVVKYQLYKCKACVSHRRNTNETHSGAAQESSTSTVGTSQVPASFPLSRRVSRPRDADLPKLHSPSRRARQAAPTPLSLHTFSYIVQPKDLGTHLPLCHAEEPALHGHASSPLTARYNIRLNQAYVDRRN